MGLEGVLGQLKQLYSELDAALAVTPSVNPCGPCNACCRSEGRVAHGVSELELLYLESQAGSQQAFRNYLAGRVQGDCPHFNASAGCRVYAWRPFSCRVFGHYSPLGSQLPPGCAYSGQTVFFQAKERLTAIPGSTRLKQLQLELTVSHGRKGAPLNRRALARPEAVERALELVRGGDPAGAVEALQGILGSGQSGYVLYNAGLVYALAGQAEPALSAFLEAAEDLPHSADVRYYAASMASFLGQRERARQLAEAARSLAPAHEGNLSLLASLYLKEQRFEAARECLEGLSGPLERFYLGEACAGLGDLETARACFAEVLRHGPLREQAEQALEALALRVGNREQGVERR